MGYEKIERQLAQFDALVARLNLTIGDSPLAQSIQQVRDFLADREAMAQEDWLAKWDPHFKDFYDSQIAVGRLCDSVTRLQGQADGTLRQYLKKILSGSLTQDFDPQEARDFFYELWIAGILAEAGFSVTLEEPDITVQGNGLSQKLGIACKYPSSEKQIHTHINKALSQLQRHGLQGFVAIGLDQIILRELFGSTFVDFNKGNKHPLDVLQSAIDAEVVKIVGERPKKY
ncbi:hypothetical protein LCGC14_2905750, partial [marine sediment metagenome]